MKQPGSGRERLVGNTVHDGTPQVTAPADAAAKDNLKDDRALRIETVINDPVTWAASAAWSNLDELAAKARACNARLMDAEIAGQGSGILANPVIERIAHPTWMRRAEGPGHALRRTPGEALAGCLAVWDFAVSGITNKRLRAWMTGLRGAPYSMNQASYDLARLRRNGLIERIARSNTYRLTARRAHLRPGLQPRPRPGAVPPHRARPADRRPRPHPRRLAGDHPTYRQHHRRRPPRTRGLTPRPADSTGCKLKSTVKVLAPQSASAPAPEQAPPTGVMYAGAARRQRSR